MPIYRALKVSIVKNSKIEKKIQIPTYSDARVQIKKHKGRGRFELYIHNEKLRRVIEDHAVTILSEQSLEWIPLVKKVLFKSSEYGNYVTVVCEFLAKKLHDESNSLSFSLIHREIIDKWGNLPDVDGEHKVRFFRFLSHEFRTYL